jgi:hypothetical protein
MKFSATVGTVDKSFTKHSCEIIVTRESSMATAVKGLFSSERRSSPKTSSGLRICRMVSLPLSETEISFTMPFLMT